jgi:hypothetical protein
MNENNYREITEKILPKIGFPDGLLNEQINTLMKNNPGGFIAKAYDTMGEDQLKYDLKFNKNEKKPEDTNYYLNAIAVTMTKPDGEVRKFEAQYFYANGYSVEQLNNLLDGRSVFKQWVGKNNEENRMWFALDLNNKDDKGNNLGLPTFENTTNFNLLIEVGKINIPGQTQDEKNKMLHDLRSGNEYFTTVKMPDGSTQKAVLVALPHVNQVAAYDMEGKKIQLSKSTMQAIPVGPKKDINSTTAGIMTGEEKNKGQGTKKSQSA